MIAAIILAAGMSTRMKRPKQVLLLHGKPMLEEVLDVFRQTTVDRVVVVLGAHQREVKAKVNFQGEVTVLNRRYAEGMSTSLKVGLAAVAKDAEAVIIALGDQPLLKPATVNKIVDAYRDSGARVVVPVFCGIRGHPVLFDRSLFPRIARISGDRGAREIVEDSTDTLVEVAVKDEGILVDIDTPASYIDVAARGKSSKQRRTIRQSGRHRRLSTLTATRDGF